MVMMRRDIGELLVERGKLSREDLQKARTLQQQTRGDLAHVLIENNMVSERDALEAKAVLLNVRFVDLASFQVDPSAINVVPISVAQRHNVIPIKKLPNALAV